MDERDEQDEQHEHRVFMAWTDAEVTEDLEGPWRELRVAAPGVVFVESADTLSRVYHELKWSLPDGAALVVAPVSQTPKSRGLRAGTHGWLRSRGR
mgnify:CR=1 FL=1